MLPTFNNRIAFSISALALFITVIILVSLHGSRPRVFAPGASSVMIDTPEQAFDIWQERNVRGRILLLFDGYPHLRGFLDYKGAPRLNRTNLVEFSIFKNIIRKVYYIVPDADWEGFRQKEEMRPIRKVSGVERGLYLYNMSGISIMATTPTSLPDPSEKVLVYINGRMFDEAYVKDILANKGINSDIIIFCSGR